MRVHLCAAVFVLAAGTPLMAQGTTTVMGGSGQTVVVHGAPGPGRITKSADRPQGVSAPVPALILNSRKIFLSNDGADAGLFPHPFTGTQDRAYGYVYKALEANKRFDLVASPAESELVLELRLTAPSGSLGGDKKRGTVDALPNFTLTIYDRLTHYILWKISQTVDQANLQKTHDKNFDSALDLLLKQLDLVASGVTPPPAATTEPSS